jgi:hypothetical protein
LDHDERVRVTMDWLKKMDVCVNEL